MAREKRNIGKEILDAIRDIKAGRGKRTIVCRGREVSAVREKLHLSQRQLAALIGVSVRTLQAWEQGRRRPSGAAMALLAIAAARPDVVYEILLSPNHGYDHMGRQLDTKAALIADFSPSVGCGRAPVLG